MRESLRTLLLVRPPRWSTLPLQDATCKGLHRRHWASRAALGTLAPIHNGDVAITVAFNSAFEVEFHDREDDVPGVPRELRYLS